MDWTEFEGPHVFLGKPAFAQKPPTKLDCFPRMHTLKSFPRTHTLKSWHLFARAIGCSKEIKTMNNYMATNTYLSTAESRKQTKQRRTETESWIQKAFWWSGCSKQLGASDPVGWTRRRQQQLRLSPSPATWILRKSPDLVEPQFLHH